MVVAGRTQHLLKSSKNITLSKNSLFSTYNPALQFQRFQKSTRSLTGNNKNETLVRLCCDCRRFHSTEYFQSSRESRPTFTKLTPQELFSGSINGSALLEDSVPSNQRAALSEDTALKLGGLINTTLSRENVQGLLNDLLPSLQDLRRRLSSEDLLETSLRRYLENPDFNVLSRIQKRSTEDVESVILILNTVIGGNVLVISNETVVLDVDVLAAVILNYATEIIKLRYPDNGLLQIILVETVRVQIGLSTIQLRPILSQVSIPVQAIDDLLTSISSNRSKRDLADLVLELVRSQLGVILNPIQTEINSVLDSVITTILSLYTAQQPTDVIASLVTSFVNTIVIRVAEVVVTIQYSINLVFSNVINGTVVVSDRRRRDVDLEFENFYDFSRIDSEISHKRMVRSTDGLLDILVSLVGNVLSILSNPLNVLVKNVFVAILSSQYETIGKIVTTPLRVIVDALINAILPCVNCVSIVW